MEYARAKAPTPILTSPRFDQLFGGEDGASLPFDDQGLFREVETVALKGTKFQILEKYNNWIVRVKTADYPTDKTLFVDRRFLEETSSQTVGRIRKIPPFQTLLYRLEALQGISYVWGGNWSKGIPEMLLFYPPKKKLDPKVKETWSLKGVDCSGLLYEVTRGATPRNTKELVHYGKEVLIAGKTTQEIVKLLKPLDLIVWVGHLVLVFNSETTIESRKDFGVIKYPIEERLFELRDKVAVNQWDEREIYPRFVVRRWHPEC